jgi:hypothetical protein
MREPGKEELEARIEELKEELYDHDRSVVDRVGLSGKPSPEEKKKRSGIIRELNRARRILYRLARGGPPKTVKLVLTGEEYQRLQKEAELEGISLNSYLKSKLLG